MQRCILFVFIIFLTSCATLDKTNIISGQRVPGLGFSFTVPTEKSWFTVVHGNSHRIRLSQLNDKDSYTIQITLNQGPVSGMYQTAEAHLEALKRHMRFENTPFGFSQLSREEWIDTRYGKVCVRYTSVGKDYMGRVNKGPATVEVFGLSCAHEKLDNVLINFEFTRRSDIGAPESKAKNYAEAFFSSVEYEHID